MPRWPNWQLAVNEFLYNSEWQHLDVYNKLLQTIVMAFVGTLFAACSPSRCPSSPPATSRRNRVGQLVHEARLRSPALGRHADLGAVLHPRLRPGPIPGIAAIFFTDTGTLGKTNTEALENIDDQQREGVRSVGASPADVQRYGVVPQVLPVFLSQALYFWESNTRSATIIGAVGAGGIGLKLIEAMRTNPGLGKRRLHGDADPRRGLRLRQHLQCAAFASDGKEGPLTILTPSSFCHGNLFSRRACLRFGAKSRHSALPVWTISRMNSMRYAHLFHAAPDDPLTRRGRRWLGRECFHRRELIRHRISSDWLRKSISELTADPAATASMPRSRRRFRTAASVNEAGSA